MDEIFDLIRAELAHQDAKWGKDRIRNSHLWMTVIGEEFGEACRASLDGEPEHYVEELVDVAASAIAAIHSMMLERGQKEPTHADDQT